MSMKMTMKKINFLIIALIAGVAFTGCLKDKDFEPYDAQKYLDLEAPILKAYVEETPELEGAVKDAETGIWYKIVEEGLQDEEDPAFYTYNFNNNNDIEAPRIRVNYEGKLVETGKTFEKTEMAAGKYMSLGEVIGGWQVAFLPKELKDKNDKIIKTGLTELGLQKGSKIRIVMPSPYGYQNQTRSGIPANSPLDFYIEVLEVLPPPSPSGN